MKAFDRKLPFTIAEKESTKMGEMGPYNQMGAPQLTPAQKEIHDRLRKYLDKNERIGVNGGQIDLLDPGEGRDPGKDYSPIGDTGFSIGTPKGDDYWKSQAGNIAADANRSLPGHAEDGLTLYQVARKHLADSGWDLNRLPEVIAYGKAQEQTGLQAQAKFFSQHKLNEPDFTKDESKAMKEAEDNFAKSPQAAHLVEQLQKKYPDLYKQYVDAYHNAITSVGTMRVDPSLAKQLPQEDESFWRVFSGTASGAGFGNGNPAISVPVTEGGKTFNPLRAVFDKLKPPAPVTGTSAPKP